MPESFNAAKKAKNGLPDYAVLATEKINPKTANIDSLPAGAIVRLINREDRLVPLAVGREMAVIKRAVELMVKARRCHGNIFFVGAGTSGRLAVMEAAECPPTFHTKASQIQAIMAGGKSAVFRSREGAEDDVREGCRAIARKAQTGDVVVGIAASGVTPFVLGALRQAKKAGCRTILLTCQPSGAPRLPFVDLVIAPNVGPEVIAGSTRMKAGTATKLVLNMLTTASMIRSGKVYGNKMVDLEIKSVKLRERAIRMVCELGGVGRAQALRYLGAARGRAKIAIVMARKKVSSRQAQKLLKKHEGFLRPILE